jgi:hypothetical protein
MIRVLPAWAASCGWLSFDKLPQLLNVVRGDMSLAETARL